jgi:hypothetical protein
MSLEVFPAVDAVNMDKPKLFGGAGWAEVVLLQPGANALDVEVVLTS